MSELKIARGKTENDVSNIPIVDGQLIIQEEYTPTTGILYLDTLDDNDNLKRVVIGSPREILPNSHTITYDGNGSTSGSTAPQNKPIGVSVFIRTNGYTKTNATFVKWNTASDGTGIDYYPHEEYTTDDNLYLYAIWEQDEPVLTNTITYYGNDATTGSTQTQTKPYDESVIIINNPFTKTDYTFKEWNTQSNGSGTSYNEGDIYSTNADLTLYAIWEQEEQPLIPSDSTVVAFELNNALDVIILSETPMTGATSVQYANNTYYYIERPNEDIADYLQYNLELYTTNTYTGHDAASRGELAYIIFDGNLTDNYFFTHNASQYLTGIYTQPVKASKQVTFREYSQSDWETTARDYDEITLTITSGNGYIVLLKVNGTATTVNGFYIVSDDAFTATVYKERYFSDGTRWTTQSWNLSQSSFTFADTTYYYCDAYTQGSLHSLMDNCSLLPTEITISSTFGNPQRGELAYIIFDGIENKAVKYASHMTNQYITGIWVQPVVVNYVTSTNPLLSMSMSRGVSRMLSAPLRTTNIPISSMNISVNGEDNIQVYQPKLEEYQNLYPLMSKEQVLNVSNGVAPTFKFDTLDVFDTQRMEIFTDVPNLQVDTITREEIDLGTKAVNIQFPPYNSNVYGKSINSLTCKVYFHSPSQSIENVDEWEEVSELPYDFSGSVCVYNNKIHIIGTNKNHYSWNGASWSEESELPYNCSDTGAIAYNNRLHIFGGSGGVWGNHYAWDGSTWTQLTNCPFAFFGKDKVVLFNNKIYLVTSSISSSGQFRLISSWNDTSWSSNVDIGEANSYWCSEVMDNKIYMLFKSNDGITCKTYDGVSTFASAVSLESPMTGAGCTSVFYNGLIHVLSSSSTSYYNQHLTYDGTQWLRINDIPSMGGITGQAVVFRGRIHILGGRNSGQLRKHYVWKGL